MENTEQVRFTAKAPLTGSLSLETPQLHPEEHAWIEQLTGRTLSNEEAQSFLREAKLTASWEAIYGKRRRGHAEVR